MESEPWGDPADGRKERSRQRDGRDRKRRRSPGERRHSPVAIPVESSSSESESAGRSRKRRSPSSEFESAGRRKRKDRDRDRDRDWDWGGERSPRDGKRRETRRKTLSSQQGLRDGHVSLDKLVKLDILEQDEERRVRILDAVSAMYKELKQFDDDLRQVQERSRKAEQKAYKMAVASYKKDIICLEFQLLQARCTDTLRGVLEFFEEKLKFVGAHAGRLDRGRTRFEVWIALLKSNPKLSKALAKNAKWPLIEKQAKSIADIFTLLQDSKHIARLEDQDDLWTISTYPLTTRQSEAVMCVARHLGYRLRAE